MGNLLSDGVAWLAGVVRDVVDDGDLVVIQRPARTYDDSRQPVLAFADFATRRAFVRPVDAAETIKAGGKEAVVTHTARLSGAGQVKHDDQLTWNGDTYQILSVVDDTMLDTTLLKIGKVET